ncbi:MAG: type I DNA topoisomerase [Clostridia bacterium]
MGQKLVIVESPAKAKTIGRFLGRNYKVEASMGHVRDLPKSQMGVDVEKGFEPKYITIRGKGEILNKIRKEAKNADKIYLATDPDREGEAISWHLAHILHIDENEPCRIEFNEITKQAIKNAIKTPRKINMNLVDAQQARRVLDRLVGYKISPLLWRKVKRGLSAGRVQSVATRMICDREQEILDFVPEEYWTIDGNFQDPVSGKSFQARFFGTKTEKLELSSENEVKKIIEALTDVEFQVVGVKKGEKKRNAPPHFTTSSLQQEASRKLGFTTRRTMMVAQQLYEGIDIKGEGTVGLISYIRTDSTRISQEAQRNALDYIRDQFGAEYAPKTPNQHRGRKGAQDAHEAIRPTSVHRYPDAIKASLSRDQYKLYKMIYERFLASQMTPARYDTLSIHIQGDQFLFRAYGSHLIFPGYTKIYEEGRDDNEEERDMQLPLLEEGQKIKLQELVPEQHFTQPPPRYTEATLVKALEEEGIGRPSTYAPTISTILARGYIRREKKNLVPTELGMIVTDLMKKYFKDIVDIQFTAEMENKLDGVEEGVTDWKRVVEEFYQPFLRTLSEADKNLEKIEIEDEVSDVICEKCGANMVYKMGRYGRFLACPNFPTCRNTKAIVEELDVPCPKCGGKLVVRKSKRGRTFYGCDKYPECDFVSWERPVAENCPQCGSYMVAKQDKRGKYHQCSSEECRHRYEIKKENE